MERLHRSIMLSEVIEILGIRPGGDYADLTFGEGGHTEAFLNLGANQVVAVDRDQEALEIYRKLGTLRDDPRLKLIHGPFSSFPDRTEGQLFDGILMDLGISTRQVLIPERGFSFSKEGPLDMRMDQNSGEALSKKLLSMSVDSLTLALERNADMKRARPLAKRLIDAAHAGELKTTSDLARISGEKEGKRHPATVLFLALRMLVNEEREEVEGVIPRLLDCLKPHGRLAVITFHSSEDRVVKRTFNLLAGKCICGEMFCACPRERKVDLVLKKPLVPGRQELRQNPRSRSAKLRCVEKASAQS